MSFPRYPKYKDSGVEWLGEVPAHWDIAPLRYTLRDGFNGLKIGPFGSQLTSTMLDPLGVFKVYGQENVIGADFDAGARFITLHKFEELGVYEILPGDVLVTMMGTSGKSAVVPDGALPGIMDSHLLRLRTNDQLRADLLCTVLNDAPYVTQQMRMMGKGSIMHGLNSSIVKDLLLLVPPAHEQHLIAEFLQREISKIQRLIAGQEELIALLQEKRQSYVSHAVTHGVNPSVATRSSGVDWLGDIPAHWEVVRMRFLCDIQTGSRDTEDAVENGEYPFFVRSQTVERIDTASADCEAVLTAGDGVGVGRVFHHFIGPFNYHQRVYMFNNFRRVSGRYLYLFLRENFYKVALEGGAKSTVDSLRRPMLANFWMCVPPAPEQAEIVQAAERFSSQVAALITEAERVIKLLQERRISLISAAVTGKIDVRNYAADQAEAA